MVRLAQGGPREESLNGLLPSAVGFDWWLACVNLPPVVRSG